MIATLNANAYHIPLADGTVQCCVTSPPYWGLRDYGLPPLVWGGKTECEHRWGNEIITKSKDSNRSDMEWMTGGSPEKKVLGRQPSQGSFCQLCGAWYGCLGLEPTPELYVEHLVAVFREVWRVLRKDGTVWLNLGDSYASQPCHNHISFRRDRAEGLYPKRDLGRLKPKDLVGIPWRVAFALQADGWWLRSDIIWHKPNPMPESVTDRPTKAHEYVFLLTKNKTYFYDADAIREVSQAIPKNDGRVIKYSGGARSGFNQVKPDDTTGFTKRWDKRYVNPAGRNRRTVWTIATHPYSGAHFATFPPKLIEPMILAGTSAKGACPKCGAAWKRVVEKLMEIERKDTYDGKQAGQDDQFSYKRLQMLVKAGREAGLPHDNTVVPRQTTGWQPTCACDAGDPVPCLVLDPFAGTSTVGQVCIQCRRSFVGLELNRAYIALAQERTNGVQVRMEL